MGIWGAIIGGTLGGILGGPWGAAIGAGLGAGMGSVISDDSGGGADVRDSARAGVPIDLAIRNDQDGLKIRVASPATLSPQAFAVVRITDASGNLVLAKNPYTSGDGKFLIVILFRNQIALGWFPVGALRHALPGKYIMQVAVYTSQTSPPIGLVRSPIELPDPKPLYLTEIYRPIIGLCMAVARADGQLQTEEVRFIRSLLRERLSIPPAEDDMLKEVLKNEPHASVSEMVEELVLRFPTMQATDIIAAMVEVANSDGTVHDEEDAVIREARHAFSNFGHSRGGPGSGGHSSNRRSKSQGGSRDSSPARDAGPDPWAVLGVDRKTSPEDLKKAYRNLMRQYHPDRVSTFPKEFQDLAHQKTIDIKNAYDTIIRRGGG